MIGADSHKRTHTVVALDPVGRRLADWEFAERINPLLAPLVGRYRLLSEPGRFIVASSMTLFMRVVSMSIRNGRHMLYTEDGKYGTLTNKFFEGLVPLVFALHELEDPLATPELLPSALGGPTCDSADMLEDGVLLPQQEIGDVLVVPGVGAYSYGAHTGFNNQPRTPMVTLRAGDYLADDLTPQDRADPRRPAALLAS